jgi:hypothetical protein
VVNQFLAAVLVGLSVSTTRIVLSFGGANLSCENGDNGGCVKPSLREILANSHVVVVAIAVLLLWSLDSGIHALGSPLLHAAGFLFSAIAILDIPYGSSTFSLADRLMLADTLSSLFYAFICFATAWLLSRWVYGVGPLCSLRNYRTRLARGKHD